MTVSEAFIKIDLRLNKSSSDDYDNLWNYVKAEALNKAINSWVRRQIHGSNVHREGDEESTMRVDDLQILLKSDPITIRDKGVYVESSKLPADYDYFKRVTPYISKGNCSGVMIKSHLREEANVDELLPSLPSFNFEETFHTLIGNRIRIFHNKDFTVDRVILTYYRKPKVYSHRKLNEIIEFKDSVCDILVDEAVKIIASDIESLNAKALAEMRADMDN